MTTTTSCDAKIRPAHLRPELVGEAPLDTALAAGPADFTDAMHRSWGNPIRNPDGVFLFTSRYLTDGLVVWDAGARSVIVGVGAVPYAEAVARDAVRTIRRGLNAAFTLHGEPLLKAWGLSLDPWPPAHRLLHALHGGRRG